MELTPTTTAMAHAAAFPRPRANGHDEAHVSLEIAGAVRLHTGLTESSPFFLGYSMDRLFPRVLGRYDFDRAFLVTSPAIFRLHGERLHAALQAHGMRCEIIAVDEGESQKSFEVLARVGDELIRRRASKASILLALGGGTIGNLTGMAAALLYRGVRFVEIPTTFMAQTDSTLSNKQAVNGGAGKNHFGVYHAPILVWCDGAYSRTESVRQLRGGLVEAVKNGLVADPEFLDWLCASLTPELRFSDAEYLDLVYRVVQSKLHIIELDPTEKAFGVILEYGHTFGHAIEWLGRGQLFHGEAVAMGMVIAADLSRRLGYLADADVARHRQILRSRLGVDLRVPPQVTTDAIIEAMASDNKRGRDGVKFVLLERIGRCRVQEGEFMVPVAGEVVRDAVDAFLANPNGGTEPGHA